MQETVVKNRPVDRGETLPGNHFLASRLFDVIRSLAAEDGVYDLRDLQQELRDLDNAGLER